MRQNLFRKKNNIFLLFNATWRENLPLQPCLFHSLSCIALSSVDRVSALTLTLFLSLSLSLSLSHTLVSGSKHTKTHRNWWCWCVWVTGCVPAAAYAAVSSKALLRVSFASDPGGNLYSGALKQARETNQTLIALWGTKPSVRWIYIVYELFLLYSCHVILTSEQVFVVCKRQLDYVISHITSFSWGWRYSCSFSTWAPSMDRFKKLYLIWWSLPLRFCFYFFIIFSINLSNCVFSLIKTRFNGNAIYLFCKWFV